MAKRTAQYELPYPIEVVRPVVADPRQVGAALAFVEETELRNGLPFWRLRTAMGAITGAEGLLLDYEVLPTDVIHWRGSSPRLVSRGEIRLAPAGPSATSVSFTLEMAGVGPASAIIEPLAGLQIEGQMSHFMEQLQAVLEPTACAS